MTSISRVMTPFPRTISTEDSLTDAIRLMSQGRYRHLPVLAEGRLAGILSERDIRYAVTHDLTAKVKEYMSPNPFQVSPDTKLKETVSTMIRLKIGSAVVVDRASKPIGIFTLTDGMRILKRTLEDEEPFVEGKASKDTGRHRPYFLYLLFVISLFFTGAFVSLSIDNSDPPQAGNNRPANTLSPEQSQPRIIIVTPKQEK